MTASFLLSLVEKYGFLLGAFSLLTGALWVGTLFSVSWLSGRSRWMADAGEIGALAVALNRRWATPCLVASLVSAFAWLCTFRNGTLDAHWFFALVGVLCALVLLHSSVGQRALRISRGSASATSGEATRRALLVLSVTVLSVLVSFSAFAAR